MTDIQGPNPVPSIVETRAGLAVPRLTKAEIDRLLPFGERRTYADGEPLMQVGERGRGLYVVLSGAIELTRNVGTGDRSIITTHEQGQFLGAIAQLSGRPALVDAFPRGAVEASAIATRGFAP